MSFVRNCITKFLLGVSAVAWTACGEDSGTSAEDSKSTSFTRNTFLNADSLIAAAKAQKPTTDSCVTAQQYCSMLFNEAGDFGAKDADMIVTERVQAILDTPESRKFSESTKRCLANLQENFFFMTHWATEYGISPCYGLEDFVPGDSTYIMAYYPEILQKILDAGACGDGVPGRIKVDSVYLNEERRNAELYAEAFEQSLNQNLNTIDEECN